MGFFNAKILKSLFWKENLSKCFTVEPNEVEHFP